MKFICQSSALSELHTLAESAAHSILLIGPEGSGKTYLSSLYSQMLGISDFQIVDPTVQSIRTAIDQCYQINNPVVLCIENLDRGVAAASYTLLKFLEEPKEHIYIVVTCRNQNRVPDTIVSRSIAVTTSSPVESDIDAFAQSKNSQRYEEVNKLTLWNCVRTFKDAETVLNMTTDQLQYFVDLESVSNFHDTVSNIVWKLGHYADNSEAPVELIIRYIMDICNSPTIRLAGMSCISDLSAGRIAAHAVLAKFVFQCKYIK